MTVVNFILTASLSIGSSGDSQIHRALQKKYYEIDIDEKLELIATLFRDTKTGLYQEKIGKIVLRQLCKSSFFGLETYKGIGLYELALHEIVQELGLQNNRSKEQNLFLDRLDGAILNVELAVVPISSDLDDETQSLMSGMSDAASISSNVIGASFDYDDVFESGDAHNKSINSQYHYMSNYSLKADQSVHELNDEDTEEYVFDDADDYHRQINNPKSQPVPTPRNSFSFSNSIKSPLSTSIQPEGKDSVLVSSPLPTDSSTVASTPIFKDVSFMTESNATLSLEATPASPPIQVI